jgi:predicted N-acetyltransferase YhbS
MMTVRSELPEDRDNALDVELLAFHQARKSDAVDDIVEAIRAVRDEEGSFALIAEHDGVIVGHVQFSRAWIGDSPLVVLGPMGVRPDYQGRGIGSELIRRGLNEAHGRGEPAVVLLGDPNFYRRFGFVAASTFGLRSPQVVQPNGFVILEEHFMIVPLDDRADSLVGPVRWSSAL